MNKVKSFGPQVPYLQKEAGLDQKHATLPPTYTFFFPQRKYLVEIQIYNN